MQRVFETIAERHEAIHYNIRMIDGILQQVKNPNFKLELGPKSMDQYGVQSLTELYEKIRGACSIAKDPETDQLFEAHLVKTGDNEHVLWTLIHHLVFDGWSYDILVHEICTLYNAFVNNKENPLPALPLQYGDYATWQRQWVDSKYVHEQLGYFIDKLDGELPILELGFQKPRPQKQNHTCEAVNFFIEQNTLEKLERIAVREGCTLFMILMSAYVLTLYRYSQQNDVIVGVPISGRHSDELNSLLGFFVNALPMRFAIDPELSFESWLKKFREVCLEAFNHQHVPFEILAQEINLERDLSHHPVYQTMFIYQDVRNRTDELEGIVKEQINVGRAGVQTDIDIWMKTGRRRPGWRHRVSGCIVR